MIQLVEFPTWSWIVNNVLLESIIDHIYVKDPTLVSGIQSTKPLFGDHFLVLITVRLEKGEPDLLIHDHKVKFKMYIMCGSLSQINNLI